MLVIMSERALVGSEGALVGLLVCEGALVGFIIPLLDVTELHLSINMQKSTTRLSVYNNMQNFHGCAVGSIYTANFMHPIYTY